MAIKIPISVDGASFSSDEIKEQRIDGTRATELTSKENLGSSLDFDGTDDYVDCGNNINLTGNLTIACWFKVSGTGFIDDWIRLVTKCSSSTDINYLFQVNNSGKLYFRSIIGGSDVEVYGDTTLQKGNWYHVAVVYNGTDIRLYVNGNLDYTPISASGSLDTTVENLYFGRAVWGVIIYYSAHQMDEIAIWSKELSADDVSDLYNSGKGLYIHKNNAFPTSGNSMGTNLEGLWHLDDGTGSTTCEDSSGRGITGTLVNMDEDTDWVSGKVNNYENPREVTLADVDSSLDDCSWDISTIELFENPNLEAGIIKYQYAYGNSISPTNWNGSWLTKTELKEKNNPSGRYFRLKLQFTLEKATISDGWIEIPGIDYPSEDDVENGVSFDNGNKTGNLVIPSEDDVMDGTGFGSNATEKTGNFTEPGIENVKKGIQYGAKGTEFTVWCKRNRIYRNFESGRNF